MKVDRLEVIQSQLFARGVVSVQDLSDQLNASLATIRRDLQYLEEAGVAERIHGGARLVGRSGIEVAFETRKRHNIEAKRAIGEYAYAMIEPHSSILFDASTTVLQAARRLKVTPVPVNVFSNSLMVAQELIGVPGIKVFLLGGLLREENLAAVGPQAERELDQLWIDHTFLGAGAISQDGTIYSVDQSEANLNAKMIARSKQCTVLADARKFGQRSTFAIAHLSQVTSVVTDAQIEPGIVDRLRDQGATINICGQGAQ
ncbi:MAG: DeoR/GlpR family DNA-binding transcription regulator [Alphaproteobacteria bacterium]